MSQQDRKTVGHADALKKAVEEKTVNAPPRPWPFPVANPQHPDYSDWHQIGLTDG